MTRAPRRPSILESPTLERLPITLAKIVLRRLAPLLAPAVSVALLGPARLVAQVARPAPAYGSTLLFGTGLVNIPVAWVSPGSGDLFAAISARAIGVGTVEPKSTGSLWDLTQSLEAHLLGRLSLGASLYGTKNQQVGAFGKLLLVKQRSEGARWIPSLAVGVRNLGSSAWQDRFATGDRRAVDVLGDSARLRGRGKINGNPSAYGVLTREFQYEKNSASLSVGYGNGLFRDNGGLDTVYNRRGTIAKGLFLGGRLVAPTGPSSAMTFMLENDGWDWNFGALLTFAHVSVGLYLTELEERKGVPDNKPLANFTKAALLFSYNASIPDIVRGSAQRAEAAEAQLEMRRLAQEIRQRTARSAELVAEMAKAQQGADRAAEEQRAALRKKLEEERDAMRKAAERLEQLQKGGKPPERAP